MVVVEFGEWFGNVGDGFAGVSRLAYENNELSSVELRSF